MKKIILGSFIGICFTTLVAFTIANYEPKKCTGEVQQLEGYYIFVDSRPVMEYEYLGTVKGAVISFGGGQYTTIRNKLIKRAKKDYPRADALIFTFIDGGIDKVDVIKFK
ncbi:MAG: hypothetical protein WCH34_00490 [Bacteroidota bacterium]